MHEEGCGMAEALIDIYLIVGNAPSATGNKAKAKVYISGGPEHSMQKKKEKRKHYG